MPSTLQLDPRAACCSAGNYRPRNVHGCRFCVARCPTVRSGPEFSHHRARSRPGTDGRTAAGLQTCMATPTGGFMKTGHGSRRLFRVLDGFGVAALAISAVPAPASAAESVGSGRTHGLSVTVDGGKVTAKGGRVVGSVRYGSGVTVTTVTSSDAAAAPWVCTVHSYDPTKNGSTVSVQADESCTGSGFTPIQVCATRSNDRGGGAGRTWEAGAVAGTPTCTPTTPRPATTARVQEHTTTTAPPTAMHRVAHTPPER
jgi:hypothetical protein